MKINVEKKKNVKTNIAIRIAGKVLRYIDASMNRATPTMHRNSSMEIALSARESAVNLRDIKTWLPKVNYKIANNKLRDLYQVRRRGGDVCRWPDGDKCHLCHLGPEPEQSVVVSNRKCCV